jgi:predicted component of type VI protein secretion system
VISFGRLREHEGTLANDVVLGLPDPMLSRQISRWHFEIRRYADGFRLRPVSDAITEVDGTAVAKGQEVPIKPGTSVRLSRVITLTFLSPPAAHATPNADATMISLEVD